MNQVIEAFRSLQEVERVVVNDRGDDWVNLTCLYNSVHGVHQEQVTLVIKWDGSESWSVDLSQGTTDHYFVMAADAGSVFYAAVGYSHYYFEG